MNQEEKDFMAEFARKNHEAFNAIIDADLAGGPRRETIFTMIKKQRPIKANPNPNKESIKKLIEIMFR